MAMVLKTGKNYDAGIIFVYVVLFLAIFTLFGCSSTRLADYSTVQHDSNDTEEPGRGAVPSQENETAPEENAPVQNDTQEAEIIPASVQDANPVCTDLQDAVRSHFGEGFIITESAKPFENAGKCKYSRLVGTSNIISVGVIHERSSTYCGDDIEEMKESFETYNTYNDYPDKKFVEGYGNISVYIEDLNHVPPIQYVLLRKDCLMVVLFVATQAEPYPETTLLDFAVRVSERIG